uniref:Uncharacterized protein n=1 Tax=Xiphophorus couchianus TaxID=32473 RepID=A0A3B5LQG2_9TELE
MFPPDPPFEGATVQSQSNLFVFGNFIAFILNSFTHLDIDDLLRWHLPSLHKCTSLCCSVSCMVVAAGLSCAAAVIIFGYSSLTLTYGEEDEDVFHQHKSAKVTFVLHRLVKGANATIILTCIISLVLSSLIGYVGFRSLPCCGCYDSRTGLVRTGSPPPLGVRLKELIMSWYNVSPKVMLLCLWKLLKQLLRC